MELSSRRLSEKMKEVITIENTEMPVREYNGQRVVTFKDIDTVHGNKTDTSKRNFNRNKKHFIDGEDFVVATRENLKRDKLSLLNIEVPTRGITLLTESGYLLIAKSFTDDLSWKVQRELVNTYFRVKAKPTTLEQPPVCQPSNTPIPKNPSWYARNQRRMYRICNNANVPQFVLEYHIMLKVGEEFDLEKANEIYKKEVGHAPEKGLDLVEHFTDLGKTADDYLDRLEELDRFYFGRRLR